MTPHAAHQLISLLTGRRVVMRPLVLRLYVGGTAKHPIEAEHYGYEPITLIPANWQMAGANAFYPDVTFRFAGPMGEVVGCYVTQEYSQQPIHAESFGEPFDVQGDGDEIEISLRIACRKATT